MTVLIFECPHPPFHNPVEKTRSRTDMTSGPKDEEKRGGGFVGNICGEVVDLLADI